MKSQLTRRRTVLTVLAFSTIAAIPAAGQSVNEDVKITADDAVSDDWFGFSVAISGANAIVGAGRHDEPGFNAGAAYLFDTTTGQQLIELTSPDAAPNDNFGISVAISDTTAIVGAALADLAKGSVYIFDVTSGLMLTKITASDRAQEDFFGTSVAISGTTIIVGANFDDDAGLGSGSAYLFDTSGQQLFKLAASDGAAGDTFGGSVAISGTKAIVGAIGVGSQAGAAYLFDTTTGQQFFKLTASDATAGDRFGRSVAISGTIAIVGAYFDNNGVGPASGSVYLFDTTTGQQIFKLTANDSAAGDYFGWSVAISGTRALVGAVAPGTGAGSGYLFDTTTGQQLFKLTASDSVVGDNFGSSVAISGTKTIVGAFLNNFRAGSAYLFTVGAPCPADLTGDGALNFFDVSAFLTAFAASDPLADFTGDGNFNFFDVSAFLTAFSAGCP